MMDKLINFFLVHAAVVLPLSVLLALLVSSKARAGFLALLRLVARPLLIAAVVALVYDGTRMLAGGTGLVMTPLGDHWEYLAPRSLVAFQALLEGKLHPLVWEAGLVRVLQLPAWLVLGALGLALTWLGRRRKVVPIFVN